MPGTLAPDVCEEALGHLIDSGGRDLTPCVHAFTGLLVALAIRHDLPDPEDAAFHALLAVQLHVGTWRATGLPARLWVLALGVQCYGQQRGRGPDRYTVS
ncbi:hypothetical protein [uncultured Deinococcus sp.]|uniref:hypothetical protein n=1 Tax=uncultured Deinococcus sp. TaxID=158789 RepID=UPI0025F86A96|nr:hypothetical protein [uncultured Deinococcus sp.]